MTIERINEDKGIQTIKIPKEMKIDDDKVYLKKVGNSLYLIPYSDPWRSLIDSLDDFTEDYLEERNQSSEQRRELFD